MRLNFTGSITIPITLSVDSPVLTTEDEVPFSTFVMRRSEEFCQTYDPRTFTWSRFNRMIQEAIDQFVENKKARIDSE